MKKFFTLLTLVLLLITTSVCVSAADANDDLSGLTDEIIAASNDLFPDKLSRKITTEDIDYNNAFKIYVGVNLFETDVHSAEEIPGTFGADGYIYELPIYLDGDTLIVDIAKGQPLNKNADFTQEEEQNILNNVGKWQVTAVKYYEGETIDYLAELQNKTGSTPNNPVLVGGLPYFRYAVALLFNDSGTISGFVPMSDVPGIEKIEAFRSENVYDYQQVKAYVNQLAASSDDKTDIYGFVEVVSPPKATSRIIIIIIILVVCAVGLIFCCKRLKPKTGEYRWK